MDAVQLLQELVGINSVCGNEEQALLYLERLMADRGFEARRLDVYPGRYNLLWSIGSGSPRVCLNAHIDTVQPSGLSCCEVRIEGDKLYGLGACDDKASVAAMVTAFTNLASNSSLVGSVDLLVSVDEEGQAGGVKTALRDGYECDFAIVGEPTSLHVIPSHCGVLFMKLYADGIASHGSTPELGINAIDRMLDLVGKIRLFGSDLPSHPLVGSPSLNLGEIHAGDQANRIPDRCEARVDVRIVPPSIASDVFQSITKIVEDIPWARVELERIEEPLDTPIDSTLVTTAIECADSLGIDAGCIGWRGWTEAQPFRTALGIDSIVLGPGNISEAHSSNEFVSLSQTLSASRLYEHIVLKLCGAVQ